jgi:tRNA/rRNA methyltransferase
VNIEIANVRIVLVRPHYAGNVGSVARVMANFGLNDLAIVNPVCDLVSHDARRLATNGVAVLDSATLYPDIHAAIANCVATLATGGLADGTQRETVVGSPIQKLPFLINSLNLGKAAIVFGPEPHGLTTEEIGFCHGMIHIPTSESCPSLNLSHAVAICLYELAKLINELDSSNNQQNALTEKEQLASHEELDRLFAHLRQGFEAIHYVYGSKADQLMHGFRHMISRCQPTNQEVRMLHGLARQMLFVAKQNGVEPKE